MQIFGKLTSTYQSTAQLLTKNLGALSQLLLRLLVARVFLSSGLTKWNGPLQFNTEKYDLFLYEFFCPEPVRAGALQLCSPETLDYVEGSFTVLVVKMMAVGAGVLEVFLPVLLIVGLLSRYAALGLLAMTLFIQLAVFPSWDHWWNPAAWWALALLAIVAQGPGKWSLDYVFNFDRVGVEEGRGHQ